MSNLNVRNNGINRPGRKRYEITADHATKKADHLEEEPAERVTLRRNSGMISQDRGELGTWRISERFNLNSSEKFETFEEAAREFEDRTNEKAPQPKWRSE